MSIRLEWVDAGEHFYMWGVTPYNYGGGDKGWECRRKEKIASQRKQVPTMVQETSHHYCANCSLSS